MSGLGNESGRVPDERGGEQSQSEIPDIKSKDDLDQNLEDIPQATGKPTLPADHEAKRD